jgi:hypothetical protein
VAVLSCASCGAEVAASEDYCFVCGAVLSVPGATVERTAAEETKDGEGSEDLASEPLEEATPPEAADAAAPDCPACGERLPRPGDRICLSCGYEIATGRPEAGRVVGLLVSFSTGQLRVAPGEELPLGRDPSYASAPTLSRFDNVSRRHATVMVDPAGAGWVRDDHSTNGTFVDDERVPPGDRLALPDGARLRLASDIVAVVQRLSGSRR